MSTVRKPIDCIVDPKRGLMFVRWQDEHESLIPLDVVRAHCPCAECRTRRETGESPALGRAGGGPGSTIPTGVTPLGNYAIQIDWEDGHRTGLYGWPLLRSLCPCDSCRSAGRDRG